MAARLKLNHGQVRRVAMRFSQQAAVKGADRSISIMRSLIAHRRYDTGKMYWSVKKELFKVGVSTQYRVGPTTFYSKWANKGRGPVYPVRAKYLRFKPKGKNYYVFAKRVGPAAPGRFAEDTATLMRLHHWT